MELLVGLFAGVLITAAVAVAVLRDRRPPQQRWLESVTRRRLLVQTRDGQTIDGQLVRNDADGIVLQPAKLDSLDRPLAGEVWIPHNRIAWVQQPGAPAGGEPR